MHYIRLLRPAKIQGSAGGLEVSLLFTITTDLGDSFLCPEDGSIDLLVAVEDTSADPAGSAAAVELRGRQLCRYKWKTAMRVLDAKVKLRPGVKKEMVNCKIAIYPTQQQPRHTSTPLGALQVGDVLPWRTGVNEVFKMGVVMPVTFELVDGVCTPVSIRTLGLGTRHVSGEDGDENLNLHFEEDIGESIARHIWDAGVITSAYLADLCSSLENIREVIPIQRDNFNILELGSGVGILGITIAGIMPRAAVAQGQTLKNARVLLTDLEEAEERARSNIARAEATLAVDTIDGGDVTIEYENLDWDEGREGRFGPLVAATLWDLVVLSDCTYNIDSLPALVGTLSALHAAKENHHDARNAGSVTSSVLLATKPRHSSEEALFGLLEDHNWECRVIKEIPLPKIGEEDEVVQVYLLQKSAA
ncbi:putative methyltransferase-domain-containing protein [Xylaria sp. FL0064]|nr:putative methyltransferase-domain-containing protein [Xylaria sp. FL0064]